MSTAEDISKKEFERGIEDCIRGVPHQPGQSDMYDSGYSHQYQIEQSVSEKSK